MNTAAGGVIVPRRSQACLIPRGRTAGERGTQSEARGSPRGRIEHGVARSAALSARARQLTPSASKREAETDQQASIRCRALARGLGAVVAVSAVAGAGVGATALAASGGSGGAAYVDKPE